MRSQRRRLDGYCAAASIAFGRLVPMLPWLFCAIVCCGLVWVPTAVTAAEALPGATAAAPETSPVAANSGVYGAMVAAWGNVPSNPPTYECVKIFDADGQRPVATGTCSGIWAQFRVPLAPGRYVVEKGGKRTVIDVAPGQWVNLAPRPLPGPVP